MKIYTKEHLTICLALLLSAHAAASEKLEIDDAWIAEAPPVSKVMAAYMEIENETHHDRQAVSMQCQAFDRAEFHRTMEKDGTASMEHQPVLNIKADSELSLKPGGYHIMLFNPAHRLVAGDKTGCSMTFDDGTTLQFDLEVKKAAAEDHSHHHHH